MQYMPFPRRQRRYHLSIVFAVLTAALVVLSSPYVGEIRAWMTLRLGASFVLVMNGVIGAAAVMVLVTSIARIRDHRALRYTLLALAAGLALWFGTGAVGASATTAAVERFHFVEYGLVTLLFVRVWRAAATGP